uniref:Uncharacterized protein n=1 Tax=Aegilops tauschii TaxID=37682 RepID=M8BQN9_AEGTA
MGFGYGLPKLRMFDQPWVQQFDKEINRTSTTSKMKEDPLRDEIKEMKDMMINDGGKSGSEVYFHALELFTSKEHRDVFSALK